MKSQRYTEKNHTGLRDAVYVSTPDSAPNFKNYVAAKINVHQ